MNKKSFVVLPSRITRVLNRLGYNCLEELNGVPEQTLKRVNGIGEGSINLLKEKMKEHGFSLIPNKNVDTFPVYKS